VTLSGKRKKVLEKLFFKLSNDFYYPVEVAHHFEDPDYSDRLIGYWQRRCRLHKEKVMLAKKVKENG